MKKALTQVVDTKGNTLLYVLSTVNNKKIEDIEECPPEKRNTKLGIINNFLHLFQIKSYYLGKYKLLRFEKIS